MGHRFKGINIIDIREHTRSNSDMDNSSNDYISGRVQLLGNTEQLAK